MISQIRPSKFGGSFNRAYSINCGAFLNCTTGVVCDSGLIGGGGYAESLHAARGNLKISPKNKKIGINIIA